MQLLRPKRFDDIVGQDCAKTCLKTLMYSAKKRHDSIPHLLLTGSAGTGKTTLVNAMANEFGADLMITNGGGIKNVKDILPYLFQLKTNSILFIDEVHRIPAKVQESLYTAMEDFRVDVKISFDLPKFTLAGATTDQGLLLKPFYDRFMVKVHLDSYDDTQIFSIILQNAILLKVGSIDPTILKKLARRSRANPRIANSHISWIRDYIVSRHIKPESFNDVHFNDCMNLIGVDGLGLTREDRIYLKYLKSKHKIPVGLKTIVASTGLSEETIENNIEPWLLQLGLIEKTPKGRVVV